MIKVGHESIESKLEWVALKPRALMVKLWE
jgi:hypothetical protein